MENKEQIVEQCRLAFTFVQKLYMEVSYFIKEVEGLLLEEDFTIGKPSGYQISSRRSSGLEPEGVNMWLLKKLAVFFAPSDKIKLERGQTTLSVKQPAKVLYLRVVLHDDKVGEPMVYAGVLYDIQKSSDTELPTKFEQVIQHIEYNDTKAFKGDIGNLNYQDSRIRFRGRLFSTPLFELNDSDAILEKIVKPCLALHEEDDAD